MDLIVHNPTLTATTDPFNGRADASITETSKSATKRTYKSLGTNPGEGTIYEIIVAVTKVPVSLPDGSVADRDFLKVTYWYKPSFTVEDDNTDTVFTGRLHWSTSLSIPLVSGLDADQFQELFEVEPFEQLRLVDAVGDVLVYPYDTWLQESPFLSGEKT